MKIGILQCDDVMDALLPQFGNYPEMLTTLFYSLVPDWEFVNYRVIDGEFPTAIDSCDAYITTGSRYGAYDDFPWIRQLENFIVSLSNQQKKLIGICFGHQIMAQALGGKVENSTKGWGIGIAFNQMNQQTPWMQPFQPSLDLIVSHQDQVTEIPANTEVLISSPFCPYYMLQYSAFMISVQGHPEFTHDYSSALMDKRADRIPAARIREGKASLTTEHDGLIMAQWFVNFFIDN